MVAGWIGLGPIGLDSIAILLPLSGTHNWHSLIFIGIYEYVDVETHSSSAACMEERHD